MTNRYLVRGLDPLVFGDGRPFGAEDGASSVRTLTLPSASTLAAALRTAWAKATFPDATMGSRWDHSLVAKIQTIACRGPFLVKSEGAHSKVVLQFPASAIGLKTKSPHGLTNGVEQRQIFLRTPRVIKEGGTNMPHDLWPMMLDPEVEKQVGVSLEQDKRSLPYFVDFDFISKLLVTGFPQGLLMSGDVIAEQSLTPPKESRVHVGINPVTQTAEKSMLFESEGVGLTDTLSWTGRDQKAVGWSVCADLATEAGVLPKLVSLGGERRLASVFPCGDEHDSFFAAPPGLTSALSGAEWVCCYLATPAIFAKGFLPGWLDANLEGSPPRTPDVRVKLVAVANGRRAHVSGWDMVNSRPKPVRWTVPAGSLYYFKVLDGEPCSLSQAWLKPISDGAQVCLDGWGLALWSRWNIQK